MDGESYTYKQLNIVFSAQITSGDVWRDWVLVSIAKYNNEMTFQALNRFSGLA